MAEYPGPAPTRLLAPALIDTGVWSWVRDRRFPHFADWFNATASEGHVLTCELIVIELTRATANADQAAVLRRRLAPIERVEMDASIWSVASEIQMALADSGDHRRVPPADLLIAATALRADVPVVHHDRDFERIAQVCALRQQRFVPDGALAA